MNVLKHMEAAFLFSLGVAVVGSIAIETSPPAQAAGAVVENSIATPTSMAVVKVSAKRMSAAEKAQSLAAERSAGGRA
ncbi:hypothetical protein [uncultured Massilia sp.]|uniref:hypothetical protein n=1 Tax=uncultured Massilia sp. TaxID=169973 RepID=UPI0025F56E51|nr:hypothetical protein [uncultured Massilia sp.]